MKQIAVAALLAATLVLPATAARADDVKVLSAGIMRYAMKDVLGNFERMTGAKVDIAYDPAGAVKTKVEKGEAADVVILTKPDIAALARARKIVPDSVQTVVRTALAVAVRKGLPKPDISSVAAVKKALLAAKSVGYFAANSEPAPGALTQRVLSRLGIAKQVAAKAKLWKSVQDQNDEKSADLIISWQPALLTKAADYELVGPLPAQLQDPSRSLWACGAAAKAADPDTAKDLCRVIASPESLGAFKSKGYLAP